MPSFEQNANRKWSVRFRYVEFGKVKNKRLSGFDTKKDADKAYTEFVNNNKQYKKSEYSSILFKDLYKKYHDHIIKNLKPSSIYEREHNFQKHILPIFGEMKVFRIGKHDIINWQDYISNATYHSKNEKKYYKHEYKTKLRGQLSNFFQYAMYYYDLPLNPVLQVPPFKNKEPKREMKVWSLEQFKQFISTFTPNDKMYKTFFSFLYLTGCRKGEAFALTWNDIDFTNKKVSINKNLTRKVEGKAYEIVSTKTGENRTIALPNNLIDLLKELNAGNKSDFVFGGTKPLAEMTVTRTFNKHIELAHVPQLHIHCLRHSHASLLISNGETIVMVAKRLGHASIEQTLNTYSHLMPNDEYKMLKHLEIAL